MVKFGFVGMNKVIVKLDDVCTHKASNLMQKNLDNVGQGEYPIYGASGYICNVNFYHQDREYVAVVKDGAGIGRAMLLPPKSSVIGTMQYLIPKDNIILPAFLFYAVKAMKLEKYYTGTTIPHIYFREYRNEKFELPTLERQQEIVDIFDKVTYVISRYKTLLLELDILIKSRFVEMFGSIHESTEYPYAAVKELADVVSGGTPNRDKAEYWDGGTIPWVKTTELQNNVIIDVDEYITEAGLADSSAKLLPAGTVLVAMYGQGKTRGMTAYLDIEASTNQACACILPSDKIDSRYLWKYFELSYNKLRSLAQGAGQPNLNGNMIKNFQVLVPPIEMQKEYVNFVQQVDKFKATVQKALGETQNLFDSLMQEYFG